MLRTENERLKEDIKLIQQRALREVSNAQLDV